MKDMKKRGILLLLTLAVLVACVACGGGGPTAEELFRLGTEAEQAQEYDQARQYYEQAAKKGNAEALTQLGSLCQDGHIEGGYEKAREYFEQAAEKQDPYGSYFIASYYELGLGGGQDDAKALKYYKQAVALGVPNLEGKVTELEEKLNA